MASYGGGYGTASYGGGYGTSAGYCEDSNDLASIRWREFFDELSGCYFLKHWLILRYS